MPTRNSLMDKIFGNKVSQKAFRTIDLQRAREVKVSQVAPDKFEPPIPECDWRRLSPKEPDRG